MGKEGVVVSVIIPTYREGANLRTLITRLYNAFNGMKLDGGAKKAVEVIVVDDNSPDNTAEVMEALKSTYPRARLEVRTKERGLSSAVVHGFGLARGDVFLVMDADLQHPPETAPKLAKKILNKGSPNIEFVLGSRYAAGAAVDKDWPLHRRIISEGAKLMVRPLTPLSDPMSGFFAIRADTYQRGASRVDVLGFKIALELFVKCGVTRYDEVGFEFGTRMAGESKLTGTVMVRFVQHLGLLYFYRYPWIVVPVLLVFFVCLLILYRISNLFIQAVSN